MCALCTPLTSTMLAQHVQGVADEKSALQTVKCVVVTCGEDLLVRLLNESDGAHGYWCCKTAVFLCTHAERTVRASASAANLIALIQQNFKNFKPSGVPA